MVEIVSPLNLPKLSVIQLHVLHFWTIKRFSDSYYFPTAQDLGKGNSLSYLSPDHDATAPNVEPVPRQTWLRAAFL